MSTTTKRSGRVRAIESIENNDSTGRQRQIKRDEAIRKKLEQDFLKKTKSSHASRSQMVGRRVPGTVSALKPGQALTVKENMLVLESAQLMAAKRCDCVLVVNDNDHLSGIFTAKDIAYRLVAEGLDAKTTPVVDIMTKDPLCVTSDTSATEALNLMVAKGFRHLPVCNEEGDIFGLLDITKCLYGALGKIERALTQNTVELNQYVESLRTTCPNLRSVLTGPPQAEVKYRTNVKDIAIMMKELRTTAVLVTKHHHLAGIFTSKDIVLRVIAAGLNPENCTVVRVMTPNPDTASPETTVIDALKLMNEGHYLNLPVLDNGIVIGVVDVLKLTYVTLEQVSGGQQNGPMWGRFWDALEETNSQLSETSAQYISPQPSTSFQSYYSDITPNESASMVNNKQSTASTTTTNTSQQEDTFTFKFTFLNNIHRVVCRPVFTELLEAVRSKMTADHGDDVGDEEWLVISYIDDEEDQVLISCDADVIDAVRLAQKMGQTRVKLIVQDIQKEVNEEEEVTIEKEEVMIEKEVPIVEEKKEENNSTKSSSTSNFLLPVAIGFLGLVITGVIIFSKRGSKK
ncbi:uncharacterized protein BX663DRAFT_449497 [Cokeromyces recurvatus]|uniref:uncharacterized protein n=1 Tax=Cokeromyces recurvatus TaxID=90255 RepID=UPI00221E5EA9|nr:uncharacterized protein BX663DRAFT_449497 [Cokeromyces recurvatus]KAI7905400.1 hypothetical protein BX663DRAFT_449497 [Cokeromyces recurvatus]